MLTRTEPELSNTSRHPAQVGSYRIVRVLGEGGMGIVYEAVDTGAVRRSVALKVVRTEFQSPEIRARFDAERQALALMDHAGIAKIFQAGETDAGEPYFAMELVKGLTLIDFCDSRRLSMNERLELFVSICNAVQHAHQKGVIHRDLKPSNILVSEQDGKPCPKIIDFGIAKALGLQLTDKTLVTQAGQPLGTVAYMSPEQAESSGMDVDTRTDIYSLGVILYMLLVGSLPIDPSKLPMHAFMFRLASGDTQTPRPSARYTALGEYRVAVADARRTDPEHLQRYLTGDLDWIVMKALDPDRTRRYETAIGFASDISHYLTHQPVTARPPTTTYRLRKFVRRHRAGVAATTVTVLALIVSAVLAAAGLVRATRAERIAAQEAESAKQVSAFLVDLFHVSDPSEARSNSVTAREILDRGAAKSATDLATQPELQSRMMFTIGKAYSALGLYDAARSQLERSLGTRTRVLGPDDPAVAETELALGDAIVSHGDVELAGKHYERALALSEKALGPDDPKTARVVAGLGGLRFSQGRYKDAEALYRRALTIDEKSLPPDDPIIARDLVGLGTTYWSLARYPEAEKTMRRALAIQERKLGPNHPDLAIVLNNLGGVLWSQNRYADALPVYQRTREIFERTLDPTHPNMASILSNLGELYWKLRRYREAEPLFRRALAIKESRLTKGNASIATTLNGLAGLLRDEKRFKEAEPLYTRALDIRVNALGRNNPSVAETATDYGALLRATGRAAEAESLAKQYPSGR